jgi:hypothetical protein
MNSKLRTKWVLVAVLGFAFAASDSPAAGAQDRCSAPYDPNDCSRLLPGPLENADAAAKRGDYATASRLRRQLAEQGNAKAQFSLGEMYEGGIGVSQDPKEAAKWYLLAAGQGDAKARAALHQKGLCNTFTVDSEKRDCLTYIADYARIVAARQSDSVTRIGNPSQDVLSRLSESQQALLLGKAVPCTGTYAFFMGSGSQNKAYWSLRCADGRSYEVELAPKAAESKVLDCSVLSAVSGVQCFKSFDEQNEARRAKEAAVRRVKEAQDKLDKTLAELKRKQLYNHCQSLSTSIGRCDSCSARMSDEQCEEFKRVREECSREGWWMNNPPPEPRYISQYRNNC